jgi:hypothetical protein
MCYVPTQIELGNNEEILWCAKDRREVRPGIGLFADFLELQDQSDQRILEYARKWGVLGICSHGIPYSHGVYPSSMLQPRPAGLEPCRLTAVLGRKHWYSDPIPSWRSLSKQLAAMQRLGAELNLDRPGDEGLWKSLPLVRGKPWRSLSAGREFLALELNILLEIGQVRPVVDWDSGKESWQLSFNAVSVCNLFGYLALSLVTSISGREIAFCSSCQKLYTPSKRPNSNRRSYCDKCGKRAAQRDASRAYRTRRRALTNA